MMVKMENEIRRTQIIFVEQLKHDENGNPSFVMSSDLISTNLLFFSWS
jgi:hypothetical protein